MSSWYWTKFWWGMLLLPGVLIVFTPIVGQSVSFTFPFLAFIATWMTVVLLLMRRFKVGPFARRGD